MRLDYGNGGWVVVDEVGVPGPVYVRFREGDDGRLRVCEVYLDSSRSDRFIDPVMLRSLPLGVIEAAVNEDAERVRSKLQVPSPDLSTLASYYGTTFGRGARRLIEAGNWVVASFRAQYLPAGASETVDGSTVPVMRVKRARPRPSARRESTYRLGGGPEDGLTDDFLRKVAKAYGAALTRGERPNVALAEQTGYPVRSVQRWVYTARQRGIMPRGSKGRAG